MSVATVKWSGNSFTASPNGFQWIKRDGSVLEGPWSLVRSVRGLQASASIQGAIPLGTWQHIGVDFENGDGFYFHSRDQEAFAVASLINQYALPHIIPKLFAALRQGQTLTFGPISLSTSTIGYKSQTWPLSDFAGHRTYQGHWMMDIGPKHAPMMKAQIMINQLPNHLALRALLNEICPDSEYTDASPDLGTMWRPSASSHDPRYPSGRQRLMILGGMLGVGALIGLGALVYFGLESRQIEQRRAEQKQKIDAAMKAAAGLPVEAGKAWKCDRKTASYDVTYAMRAPSNVDRPGLLDKDEPFGLSGGSPTVPWAAHYFMSVDLRTLTEKDAEMKRVATMAVQLIDTTTMGSACAGEVKVRFPDRDKYDVQINLAKALTLLTCKDDDSDCRRAKEYVSIVDPNAPASPPSGAPTSAPAPTTKKKR